MAPKARFGARIRHHWKNLIICWPRLGACEVHHEEAELRVESQRGGDTEVLLRPVSSGTRGWLLVAVIAMIAIPAQARLRDIRTALLPNQPKVQKAYDAALKVEPMAEQWTAPWRYPVPRAKVAATLSTCLVELKDAEITYPHNEELFLLTGIVASYAYNLDVKGAYDAATTSLKDALKLAPNDPRPEWLLGSFYCGSGNKTLEGMDSLLKIESRFDWQKLPADFWGSYMMCATLTNMPAHVLRAASRLSQLGPLSATAKWEVEMANKRVVETSVAKTYTPTESWSVNKTSAGIQLFSDACGFGFPDGDQRNWGVYGIHNGVCMVRAKVGPFQGKDGTVVPEILVLARPPKPGETLRDFGQIYARRTGAHPVSPVACPVSACLAFGTGKQAKMYARNGGGTAMLTVFESKAPRFPGLIFEQPRTPPVAKPGSKVQYFRAEPERQRLAGTLYYLVLLDTADSVLNQASNNYRQLLKTLEIDTLKTDSQP